MRTLYITDLDGTFLNDNAEVSKESRDIINTLSKDGLLFSVATARSLLSARELLDGIEFNAPIVLSSGVFVYDMKEKKTVKCFYLSDNNFSKIISIFESADKSPFVFFFCHIFSFPVNRILKTPVCVTHLLLYNGFDVL